VAQLTVSDGIVSVTADSSKRVTYGELIGGRKFNTTLTGSNINATTGAAGSRTSTSSRSSGIHRSVTTSRRRWTAR
jgi:hypothetical protein